MYEYTVHFYAITWGGKDLPDETVTVRADCARDALIAAERIMDRRHMASMAMQIIQEEGKA